MRKVTPSSCSWIFTCAMVRARARTHTRKVRKCNKHPCICSCVYLGRERESGETRKERRAIIWKPQGGFWPRIQILSSVFSRRRTLLQWSATLGSGGGQGVGLLRLIQRTQTPSTGTKYSFLQTLLAYTLHNVQLCVCRKAGRSLNVICW